MPCPIFFTVEVSVDPLTAFMVFTEEINLWWKPGPINWYDSYRAIGTRMEPGVGGRWLEVYDDEANDVLDAWLVQMKSRNLPEFQSFAVGERRTKTP